ncbi:MAG: proline--tRNA ligase [Chloroflexi bacterium]|nr:MAG: proline--tRNA ligase [Chloroflexota bacterium]MBL1193607.1 proline--tRNA ligase [Chloroflexota bacterium]NOH10899.1 proline--tRNA ligase [Chloroflexota bacterium]
MFGQTLREAPADAEVVSHQLLVRAGFIRQLGAGIYTLMPLGMRTTVKVETILREEMNRIGGQEIFMPVVHPAELWKETGRWYKIGDEMSRFHDKNGRDMVLAMTHEEVVADLVRKDIQSYRQLPRMVYHLQTKWRDDPRPRAGLIRVREFTMKDSYTLDKDEEGLDKQYRAHYQAYFDIFNRCSLPVIAVGADVGMMGGSLAHEYMYLTPIGEDTLLLSDCGYKANRQIALFKKPEPEAEDALDVEKVATPDVATIEALAEFLDIPKSRTAKAVFLMATFSEEKKDVEKLVFAVVRGDMDLNETKLMNAVKAKELRPAHDEEIADVGAVAGYASPIGINKEKIILVVDDLIPNLPNLVAGANEAGFHLRNTNYGRDYEAEIVADIVSAEEGYLCPKCGEPMQAQRGVEVGNIFKLGTDFTVPMGGNFLDEDGKEKPVIMGSYGIGSGRLVQSVVEEHNDENGIIWPISVAPYHVHLVGLRGGEEAAAKLYDELEAAGLEVLYDDRDESPGVKFKDADLIGVPIRITVSKRSLEEGSTEFKLRREDDRQKVALEDTVAKALEYKATLEAEVASTVVEIPYED